MATRSADPPSRDPELRDGARLRAVISERMLLFFVLGDVLGAGIYALIGEVGGKVGGAIWASFLVAMILALLTAFSYAELVTKYPHAGGAALYVNRAFGIRFLTFMVTFAVAASGITSASTLARAFGGDYLGAFVELPVVLVGLVFITALALVNFRGIDESVKLNLSLTAIEVAGLLLVVVIGVAALLDGQGDPGRALELREGESALVAVLSGASLAFFALIGFEDSVNVSEETRDPRRAYPRALFGGLLAAGAIYMLVTVVASMAVESSTLAGSDGPLLEVVKRGPLAIDTKVFSAIALFALTNGALINMIMASRLLYGMARQGVVPSPLAGVHPVRRTPVVAIAATTLAAMVLISVGDLATLAKTTVLLLLVVFTAVNVSVLVLRRERVDRPHFTAPSATPVLASLGSIAVMTQQEARVFGIAGIVLAVGAALWALNQIAAWGRP